MYSINFKNVRKGYMFGGAFLAGGVIVLIIISIFILGGKIKKSEMDSEIRADRVEEVERFDRESGRMYSPVYYYTVDGKEYIYQPSYSASTHVDKTKDMVYYNSSNPNDCVVESEVSSEGFIYIFLILPVVFITVGIINIKTINKKIKKMKYLEKNGTLIKGLKYKMVSTNISINGNNLRAICVDYELPSGSTIKLTGEPIYSRMQSDSDGLADLLIDPNDTSNYYIDFNIS